MPIVPIHLKNASLDKQSSSESSESDSTSALSNLLDTLKLSAQTIHITPKKRVPVDPCEQRTASPPDALAALTQLTASLSASSEDISEAISKTFDMFRSQATVASMSMGSVKDTELRQEEGVMRCQSTDDRILRYSENHKKGKGHWAALPMPPGFRQSRSIDESFLTRSERTTNILRRIATKGSESEDSAIIRATESEDSGEGWEETTANTGSRDVSLLDVISNAGSREENEEADDDGTVFDTDEEESGHKQENEAQDAFDIAEDDDDSLLSGYDSVRTTDTMDSQGDDIASVADGLVALGGVLYELGTCNFQENAEVDFDDDYTIASGTYPPMAETTNTKYAKQRRPRTPPSDTVYLAFDDARMKGHSSGKSVSARAPTPRAKKGIFSSMFACGGPLP
ncbi:MAG: hypothetical protein JRN15_17470 [Nitrososphaerota archaeon]|nr:hypothetical protein [Nitrososphaerota archaeon]